MLSEEKIRSRYGADVVVSRKGAFTLIHLDRPDPALVDVRTRSFDPDEYFDPDCPLCAIARARGVVVFDDDDDLDEEILIE